MIQIRRAADRGHANHGWLDTYHSFSFAGFHDADWMGYRGLRVLNQDRIAPGSGFGEHPHRDMEIVSFVIDGALGHRDSMGNQHTLRPGDVQRMSAGTGVRHSEWNQDPGVTEFLQMWLPPTEAGLTPSYDQRAFDLRAQNRLVPVASPARQPTAGTVQLHANAWLHAGRLDAGTKLRQPLDNASNAWLHVARGAIRADDQMLGAGDGAAIEEQTTLTLQAEDASVVILWELP